MQRIAFKMYLKPGCEDEYERRHREIWPELFKLLKESGIIEYSIFFDKTTNSLFAIQITDGVGSQALGENEIVKKWWEYMVDIMETNPDNSPVCDFLCEVFHLEHDV